MNDLVFQSYTQETTDDQGINKTYDFLLKKVIELRAKRARKDALLHYGNLPIVGNATIKAP